MESIINISKVKRRTKIVMLFLKCINNPLGELMFTKNGIISTKFQDKLGDYLTYNCVK